MLRSPGFGVFPLVFAVCLVASAADIEPSSLPVSQARGLLGDWVLTVDTPDGEMNLALNFSDVDGKLAAILQSPEQTQPQVVTDITQSSLALKLRYAAQFGETSTGMVLIVRQLDAGTLTGSMADDLGLLSSGATPDATARGLGQFAARVRGVRGGKIPGRTTIDLEGKEIRITFAGLRMGSDDFKRFESVDDGEVFGFTSARATKAFVGSDLAFGNTIIKSSDTAPDFPDYPGVYSLWLKKVGDGWHLLFNEQADIWGSQHESTFDVAEIPLTLTTGDTEEKRFEVELEERQGGGRLQIAWGSNRWSADFSAIR